MREQFVRALPVASTFGSLAVGASALTYFLAGEGMLNNDGVDFSDALAMQGLTRDQYNGIKDSVVPLSQAQHHLEYTAPDTNCTSVIGISTGCNNENFPEIQIVVSSLDTAETNLLQAGKTEQNELLENVERSIKEDAEKRAQDPNTEPLTSATYVNQRLILENLRKDLEAEELAISTEANNNTKGNSQTKKGEIVGGTGALGLVAGMISGIWWGIDRSIQNDKKKKQKKREN